MSEEQFWAVLTSKRDEGLAHVTSVIDRSGVDEFCEFLSSKVLPAIMSDKSSSTQLLIAHMAMVGAVDALLAHRDKEA